MGRSRPVVECNLHWICNIPTFKEEFAKRFGNSCGLPQPVTTRWNIVLRHIKSFLSKDMEAINKVEATVSVQFTQREWAQLKDLASLLEPFYEATNLTEGKRSVWIVVALAHLVNFIISYCKFWWFVRSIVLAIRKKTMVAACSFIDNTFDC